jgi:quinol monooxygenase YgiN
MDSNRFRFSTHIGMTVEWLVPPGQARSVTMALQLISSESRKARGCTACSISTELRNGVAVRYTEEWQTEDDLRDHVRSPTFGHLISLIEAAIRQPHVEFRLPEGNRGLDYVVDIRRSPA